MLMNVLTATVIDGQIVPDSPIDLPNGTRLELIPRPFPARKVGLDPSEWRDDAAALADWDHWIKTFEPVELTADEEADLTRSREEMRRRELDIVRRQMTEGIE
jgi:hypothetical protein